VAEEKWLHPAKEIKTGTLQNILKDLDLKM